ncbi:hypothetical protein D9M70_579890 [compost metagenome]
MPPADASAFITVSDLLRSAAAHECGLAWLMVMGRSDRSIASSVERSPEWLMSITSPTRFISLITSRPMRVMPLSTDS